VHFTRNAQDLVPRSARSMVASAIRSVFEQPDGPSAREQLDRVVDGMARPYPRVAALLAEAEPDLLSHFAFPATHRSRIRSTNPLERLNKEIKRQSSVVGIFLRVLLGGSTGSSTVGAIVTEGPRVTRNLSVEPLWF
jgi:putative transposase